MMEKRTRGLHKFFRTTASDICDPDLNKKYLKFTYSYPVGQQSCPIVCLENGGYTKSRAFKNQQVNLALSPFSCDHNYCRIFSKQVECPSRLVVSEYQRSFRLEAASKHVSRNILNIQLWISRHPGCATNFNNK